MLTAAVFCSGVLAFAGCSKQTQKGVTPSEDAVAVVAGGVGGSAPTGTLPGQPGGVVKRYGIDWFENDPEGAFSAARAAGKRVVVDLWAPWCHTCLSMQKFVLTAENLPNVSERFVWLAIDTELESNAPILTKLPVAVWPTFYVVDPSDPEKDPEVVGRWLGAASPGQFVRFVSESDRSAELARAGSSNDGGPLRALAEADALAARGEHAAAAAAYAAALRQAPPSWPRRPEALVAQITALSKLKDVPACLELAARELGHTGSSASAVDFSSYALDCADNSRVEGSRSEVAALRQAVAARLQPLCRLGSGELTPDDRADACDKLSAAQAALGDKDAARAATQARLSVLERAAVGKPADVAFTYDWARTDALITLGRAEEALALAAERQTQLPGNYNPPHYRAKSLKALGRWQEGLAALDQALHLAYGPRKVGLLTLKADLQLGAGDAAGAIRTLREQLDQYRSLPGGQRQPAAEARVEKRLREASAAAPPVPGR